MIAPYGHERRPGAAAEIRFDRAASPGPRLVLTGTWERQLNESGSVPYADVREDAVEGQQR